IFITPGFSGKKPVIELPGVETFQRSFTQDPGKFCTPFCTMRTLSVALRFLYSISVNLFSAIIHLSSFSVQQSVQQIYALLLNHVGQPGTTK
ncbi:MAG: hypothetical protein M0R33_13710, partial [Methylomonas sp.]|uniref:hypothetical protein n=1 Tax=Methylomonas sp. TaxID=418 RepID=UPI0025F972E7